MGDKLPVKARLVRANNQWGMKKTPLIKVSLYELVVLCLMYSCHNRVKEKLYRNRIKDYNKS
ncbi:hypothetical protein COE51_11430 [Bacillus pseudomycoides]|nr:hypothetical protein COE51_11430 [Bacillus pseudomycoides]